MDFMTNESYPTDRREFSMMLGVKLNKIEDKSKRKLSEIVLIIGTFHVENLE